MKTGTKSVLFGAHQIFLHPVFVTIAWIKLYGFPWDIRVWIAFFVHDLGYWGKPNMDGQEGERHPETGAKIMHWLFDGYVYKEVGYKTELFELHDYTKTEKLTGNWDVCDILEMGEQISVLYQRRRMYWRNFTLYHSRYYAKRDNAKPSKLCYADKMAFVITPRWLYLPMTKCTGEVYEYIRNAGYGMYALHPHPLKNWHKDAITATREWVSEHIDGKPDTWTRNRHGEDPLSVLREDTYTNEEINQMTGSMIREHNMKGQS